MSKRYSQGTMEGTGLHYMTEDENGLYVRHEDYAKILSQRDRLVAVLCSMLPIEFDQETGMMKLRKESEEY